MKTEISPAGQFLATSMPFSARRSPLMASSRFRARDLVGWGSV